MPAGPHTVSIPPGPALLLPLCCPSAGLHYLKPSHPSPVSCPVPQDPLFLPLPLP